MKYIILFFSTFIISCSTLKVDTKTTLYSLETIDIFIEKNHKISSNINDIPIRILKALNTDGVYFTTDTLEYNKNKMKFLLIKFGINHDNKKGYFIVKTQDKYNCILFLIDKKVVGFTHYTLPYNCNEWETIKPFLIPNNAKLSIGGKSR